MNTLADRMKIALMQSGLKRTELAKRVGISAPSVTGWTTGATKSIDGANLVRAAAVLGVSADWLATGRGSMVDDETQPPTRPALANTSAPPRLYRYPLISTVQAGQWAAIVDTFAPGDADEWPESPKRAGKHAFWLKIEGDSMEPRFTQGGMVLVDPDAAADAGAFVVAKLVDSQEATFKKLATDAGRWYLVPLNKQYDAILIDDPTLRVIGRVVFYQPQGEVL